MLLKPGGKCSDCKNRKTCEVVTETRAKVLECYDYKRREKNSK